MLIVDDEGLVRAGLAMMLGGAADVEIVGEAEDGTQVLAAIDAHRPDVVLMDIRMPSSTAWRQRGSCGPAPGRVLISPLVHDAGLSRH